MGRQVSSLSGLWTSTLWLCSLPWNLMQRSRSGKETDFCFLLQWEPGLAMKYQAPCLKSSLIIGKLQCISKFSVIFTVSNLPLKRRNSKLQVQVPHGNRNSTQTLLNVEDFLPWIMARPGVGLTLGWFNGSALSPRTLLVLSFSAFLHVHFFLRHASNQKQRRVRLPLTFSWGQEHSSGTCWRISLHILGFCK